MRAPAARAARLLRWYPRAWRSRYGAEFAELLVADVEERPRSRSRTADVIRGGIVARLGQAGLCGAGVWGDPPEPGPRADTRPGPAGRTGASLASLGCCAAVFAAVGGAMWSQLTTGWQWSPPIPRCQRLGLGRAPRRIAVMGISMGGYGALLLAEKYPRLFAAVAAISPAVWTSYGQARSANAGAYASAAAFADADVVTHAAALRGCPVRVASGYADPFYPGVQALAREVPAGAVVSFGPGCHDDSFFAAQQPPSLAFLAAHLS
ncbi:MAG TPA: alpha/beta hydrolase-fold protein [Streptosporangiaceae bacterium]|nr:alpha/beta hydrolase-fold protein [Streptosporangiaceae bacterium]